MISCQQYDYIELVCVYHYPINITLKNGKLIEGIALDTTRNVSGDECISINYDGQLINVILQNIKLLKVAVENPHFKEISFV